MLNSKKRIKTEDELNRSVHSMVVMKKLTGVLSVLFMSLSFIDIFVLCLLVFLTVINVVQGFHTIIFGAMVVPFITVIIGGFFWLTHDSIQNSIVKSHFVHGKKMLWLCKEIGAYEDLTASLNQYLTVRPLLTLTEYRDFSKEVKKRKRVICEASYREVWSKNRQCYMGEPVA